MFINLILGDKADTARPLLWRVVKDIVYGEAARMCSGEVVEFLLQEDILHINVGVNKAQAGIVRRVLQCSTNDLQHGSNTGATSNHSDFARQGRAVLEEPLGTANSNFVADFQERHVARDVTLLVRLSIVVRI